MAKVESRDERLKRVREKLSKTEFSSWKGTPTWKPKAGRNVIRILPGAGKMGDFFWQDVGSHYPPGSNKGFICPDFTIGEKCPICEFADSLFQAGDDESKDLARNLKKRKQFWMNIIDREDEDRGVQIYKPGTTVFQAIAALINDPDYGEIYDPDNGQDVIIKRAGTGIDTKYDVMVRPKPSSLHSDPEKVDEWLDSAPDLSPVGLTDNSSEDDNITKNEEGWVINPVAIMPYDRLNAEFHQIDLDAAENSGSGEDELRRRIKAKRKPRDLDKELPMPEDEEVDETISPAKKPISIKTSSTTEESEDGSDEVDNIIRRRRSARKA